MDVSMQKFIAITITVLCLSAFISGECHADSLPAQEQGASVRGDNERKDKDATPKQKKTTDDGPINKTKGTDREEPEYDMDFEIDFDDERC